MEIKYYCNKPCELLATLPNGESVISIDVGEYYESFGDTDEGGYSEPIKQTIIVPSEYISDKMIDVKQEFVEMKNKLIQEKESINDGARKELLQIREQIEKSRKELADRVKIYSGLNQFLEYLDGELKYVVFTDNRIKIANINDCFCSYEKTQLSAIIFRAYREKSPFQIKLCMGEYSDDSGRPQPVVGFKTEEEAVKYVKELLDKVRDENFYYFEEVCRKYKITNDRFESYLNQKKEKESQEAKKELKRIREREKQLLLETGEQPHDPRT